jgi:hypothetical protein
MNIHKIENTRDGVERLAAKAAGYKYKARLLGLAWLVLIS